MLRIGAAVVACLAVLGIAFGAYFVSEAIDGTSVAQETEEPTAAALAATAEPSPEPSAAPAEAEAEAGATPEEVLPPTPVFEGPRRLQKRTEPSRASWANWATSSSWSLIPRTITRVLSLTSLPLTWRGLSSTSAFPVPSWIWPAHARAP